MYALYLAMAVNVKLHRVCRTGTADCVETNLVSVMRFDFDSTAVRRPFECLSKVIKVTVQQPTHR